MYPYRSISHDDPSLGNELVNHRTDIQRSKRNRMTPLKIIIANMITII